MNKLDQVLEAVRKLPQDRLDELAVVVESMTAPRREYTAEQVRKMEEGYADAEAGRFASDEEIAAIFAKYRNA